MLSSLKDKVFQFYYKEKVFQFYYKRVTLVDNLTPDAYGAYRKLAPFYRSHLSDPELGLSSLFGKSVTMNELYEIVNPKTTLEWNDFMAPTRRTAGVMWALLSDANREDILKTIRDS